ncbi:hypothetical protein [Hymenobacter sp. CRA2]|uniref:hypothetical protein n=1 Tax=Hymenobacter sp. CRA2 TaxID=1955620 RepID=UPI00098ED585|nr:hypothetical protein [Hymenobacter sp. CRA2]OON67652.1 hypothetical protein B0919_17675 [Hymenobacter sp. CRA2]
MAIWQYQLTVLPAAGVEQQLGHLPTQLFIDHAGWNRHWADQPQLADPAIYDAYTIDWWTDTGVAAQALVDALDQLLTRVVWNASGTTFYRWKGEPVDHDASVAVGPSDGYVSEFTFRTDMRDVEQAVWFLEAVLSICQRHDLLVMDAEGRLFAPRLRELLPSLEQCTAVRFLINPREFLEQVLRKSDDH